KVGKDRYHDVVVTGFDEEHADVFVNDPAKGENRRISQGRFEERWARADQWTLRVLPEAEPYEDPARPVAETTAGPGENYDAPPGLGISLGNSGKNAATAHPR